MKLFYCTGLFFPARVANRTTIMKTCEALRRVGVDVTLFVTALTASLTEVEAFYGVRQTFPVRVLEVISRKRFKSLSYAFKYAEIIKVEKPDLIYLRETKLALFIRLIVGRRLRFVYEIHNEGPDFISKLIHRYLLPRATGVVCITRSMQLALENKYAFLRGRTALAPMAFDPDLFPAAALPVNAVARQELKLKTEQSVVLYVGSTLDEWKGFKFFMDAAGLIPSAQFLVLGGNQVSIAKWQAYALQNHINNVRFEGYITNKTPYYGAASVLVATTSRELNDTGDSPMKIFEYMATGKPIVAMAGIVVKEVLKHQYNAILVEERSAQALAQGIVEVLKDSTRAEALAQQALQDSAKYSWLARAKAIKVFLEKTYGA